jgi:endonuclease/exonuclease/phosphatase (EEP) superfamily protein YafD
MRFLRFGVVAMAITGSAAVALAFLDDWHWYADLIVQLRPQYCVWLVLAALGALFLRHRWAFAIAATGLLVNVVALAPYALPSRERIGSATVPALTFVSLNLLQGNQDVARVTGYLRRAQADVVVFQEVSPRWEAALEELQDLYPYRFAQSRKDQFGLALFSKEKPAEVSFRSVGNRAGDLAVFAAWDGEGGRFALAGVHPDKPDEHWKTLNRRTYLSNIAQWSHEKLRNDVPVIAIGDFNATPWSSSMRAFSRDAKLRNTSHGASFSATWNVWQPHRLLIDHAFLSSHWILLNRQVGPAVGSDHRPLLIRAALGEK